MTAGSGRNSGRRRGGRPRLSDEDRSLWQRVASSIEPLQQKHRVPEVDAAAADPDLPAASHQAIAPTETKKTNTGRTADRTGGAGTVRAPPRKQVGAAQSSREGLGPLPTVHRRQARRIATGAIEIEDRLDLHGATQSVGHSRLIGFLQSSAARGLKTVLVITGKGTSRERILSSAARREGDDIGILRRSVPRWLAEAPLRLLVVSYQTAAHRHGGEGAFYIILRRSRRPG